VFQKATFVSKIGMILALCLSKYLLFGIKLDKSHAKSYLRTQIGWFNAGNYFVAERKMTVDNESFI